MKTAKILKIIGWTIIVMAITLGIYQCFDLVEVTGGDTNLRALVKAVTFLVYAIYTIFGLIGVIIMLVGYIVQLKQKC
jgi:hypothetical protein